MREEILRDFFLNKVTARQLDVDIRSTYKGRDGLVTEHRIVDMNETFTVTRSMLISLCDSVVAGDLSPKLLEPIGFALVASDKFEWDDDIIAGVVHDWSAPEINFPLTLEAVADFRNWLLGIGPFPPHWGQC